MTQKELKRVLSKLGVASRKVSEGIIRQGRITVNGRKITNPVQPVSFTDNILMDGEKIGRKKMEVYALNKPKGYITTMSEKESRKKVLDLMPKHQYLFPVGRLDKDSKGLLLLTNDNNFGNQVLSQEFGVDKIYRVKVKGEFKKEDRDKMLEPIEFRGVKYTIKNVEILKASPSSSWIKIVLNEGKNREIRKVLRAFDYSVKELIRVQIGKLKLKDVDIEPGEYKLVDKRDIV